jgi:hypothetical protein
MDAAAQDEGGMQGPDMGQAPAYEYSYGSMMERYASVMKDLTDPSYLLPLIEMDLRRLREVRDPKTGRISLVNFGEPLLNEEGVNNIMSTVRMIVNNNTTMNELNDDTIERIMAMLTTTTIKMLMLNRGLYDIKNKTDRDIILHLVIMPIFLTLNRSRAGGERKFWQHRPGTAEPQNKGASWWNPFGKSRGG